MARYHNTLKLKFSVIYTDSVGINSFKIINLFRFKHFWEKNNHVSGFLPLWYTMIFAATFKVLFCFTAEVCHEARCTGPSSVGWSPPRDGRLSWTLQHLPGDAEAKAFCRVRVASEASLHVLDRWKCLNNHFMRNLDFAVSFLWDVFSQNLLWGNPGFASTHWPRILADGLYDKPGEVVGGVTFLSHY